jgi:hypothetical protein
LPGANDDGSGSAAVIELARVLSQSEHESTVVFALFGGEEQGLKGSSHFVDHFPMIGDVVLMIQLDMTDGSGALIPLIDAGNISAPEWLVSAAYEEASSLGITSIEYATHFLTLNNAIPGGGIGSDHMPFLREGIPAIDFTSDINDPIHTPQDTYENFTLAGLKRSGDLAYRLVERFDQGVPEGSSDRYFLMQIGSSPLFIPPAVVALFLALSIGIGSFALLLMRKRRELETPRRKIPGLKLFLLLMIIQAFVWISESIVEFIKGDRFPWYQDSSGFFAIGLLGGLLGIWVSYRLIPKLGMSTDAYRYALRAVITLVIFIGVTALGSLNLALYPASALFLLSIAFLIRQPVVRSLVWLWSPYLMYRLVFSEAFGLLSRAATMIPETFGAELFFHLFLILFFSLWSFPFLSGFAALRFDSSGNFLKLRWFTSKAGIAIAGLLFIAAVVWLSLEPSYSPLWKQQITVRQTLDMNSEKGRITVNSNEYLDGAQIQWGSRDTMITDRATAVDLGEFTPPEVPWMRLARTAEVTGDSTRRISLLLTISTEHRPYTLFLRYQSGRGKLSDVSSPFVYSMADDGFSLQWYSFPDTALTIPVSFTVADSASVSEEVTATFKEAVVPVTVTKPVSVTTTETEISRRESLDPTIWR